MSSNHTLDVARSKTQNLLEPWHVCCQCVLISLCNYCVLKAVPFRVKMLNLSLRVSLMIH
jgi:hypothetical protein